MLRPVFLLALIAVLSHYTSAQNWGRRRTGGGWQPNRQQYGGNNNWGNNNRQTSRWTATINGRTITGTGPMPSMNDLMRKYGGGGGGGMPNRGGGTPNRGGGGTPNRGGGGTPNRGGGTPNRGGGGNNNGGWNNGGGGGGGKSLKGGNMKKDFLKQHNEWRQKEGANLPDLKWDKELARLAEGNVRTCRMAHDSRGKSTKKFSGIGQNLYMTSIKGLGPREAAKRSVSSWMSEKKDYNYGSNSCSRVCGHYTQVVWKASTHVGCAVSKTCGGGTFVACNYGPPGNYIGQKPY